MAAARMTIGGMLVLAASPRAAVAQDALLASFRDTLIVRQIAHRAPCPQPPPPAWSLVDSTIGTSWKCSLIEASARAITQRRDARPRDGGAMDPRNPLCTRLVVARNTGSTGLPGDWLVLFDLALDLPAWVLFDRQTGSIARVAIGHGQAIPGMPRCLP